MLLALKIDKAESLPPKHGPVDEQDFALEVERRLLDSDDGRTPNT
jgi:hypothetical protein